MKKLMTMIAAAAMSFGLFADAVTTSFESTQDGVDIGTMKFTPGTGWTWEGTPAMFDLTASTDQNAPYTAEGTENARRTTELGVNQANYMEVKTGTDELILSAGSGNVFLDQLVKFTGFDETPDFTTADGAKVAVWMSEFENNDETTETNLYVTCAKVLADGTATTESFKIDGTFELDTWYRLTVRNIGDIVANPSADHPSRAGFVVYINGNLMGSADAREVYYNSLLKGKAQAYNQAGQLFPAIDTTDVALKSIAYKGQGAIDDILIDADGPAFAQEAIFTLKAIDGIDHFVVSNGNVEVVADNGEYAVKNGAMIDIYAIPAEGKFVNPASKQMAATSGDIDLSGEIIVTDAEAKIVISAETTYYKTFSDDDGAFAAADAAAAAGPQLLALKNELETEFDGVAIAGISNNDKILMSVKDGITNWSFSDVSLSGTVTNRSINAAEVTLSAALTIGDDATLTAERVAVAVYGITLKGSGTLVTTSDLTVTPGDVSKIVKKDGPDEDAFYTYTLVDPPAEVALTIVTTGATITGVEVGTVLEGSNITFTVTEATGYKNVAAEATGVTLDKSQAPTYSFTVGKSPIQITVTATPIQYATYKVTADEGVESYVVSNTTDAVAADAKFDIDEKVTLTVYPTLKANYELVEAECVLTAKLTEAKEYELTVVTKESAPEIPPVAPGGAPVVVKEEDADKVVITATAPTGSGITDKEYTAYFKKSVVNIGEGKVSVMAVLDETAIEFTESVEDLGEEVGKIAAGAESATIAAKPGLYYYVEEADDVTKIAEPARDRVMATGETVTVPMTKFEGSGFYRLNCSTTQRGIVTGGQD